MDPRSVEDGDLHKRVIDTIGILDLRDELVDVLGRFGLPWRPFQHWDTWKGILSLLLRDLAAKPIMFPDPITNGRHKRIYKAIHIEAEAKGQPEWAVIGFRYFADGTRPMWEVFTEELKRRRLRLMGPVTLPPGGRRGR